MSGYVGLIRNKLACAENIKDTKLISYPKNFTYNFYNSFLGYHTDKPNQANQSFTDVRESLEYLLPSLFRRKWKVSWIWIWIVPKWFPSKVIYCNLCFFQNFLPFASILRTNQKWARCYRNVVFINENYCMLRTLTIFT